MTKIFKNLTYLNNKDFHGIGQDLRASSTLQKSWLNDVYSIYVSFFKEYVKFYYPLSEKNIDNHILIGYICET